MSRKDKISYMETIGSRIKLRRRALGLTQEQIGRKLGVSAVAVGNWEREDNKIDGTNLMYLKQVLECTPEYIIFGHSEGVGEPQAQYGKNTGKVPILSSVKAGNFAEAANNFDPENRNDWVSPPNDNYSINSFALRVEGVSMEPKFTSQDIIIIDPERDAVSGSYVIAKRAADGKITFKQLIQEDGEFYLKALNPIWPNRIIRMHEEWEICGVLSGKVEIF